jgi:hypothetical protein
MDSGSIDDFHVAKGSNILGGILESVVGSGAITATPVVGLAGVVVFGISNLILSKSL